MHTHAWTVRRIAAVGVLAASVGCTSLAATATASGTVPPPTKLAMGEWLMNRGGQPVKVKKTLERGETSMFDNLQLPAASDAGWKAAPVDAKGAVTFQEASILAANRIGCRQGYDFTFFAVDVSIPKDTALSEFTITFRAVDDIARAYVVNSKSPQGAFVPGGDIVKDPTNINPVKTANLNSLAVAGEVNRVVVAQVDICGMGNNLVGTSVSVNSAPPAIDPTIKLTGEKAIDPTATPDSLEVVAESAQAKIDGFAKAGTWLKLQLNEADGVKCLESNGVGDPNATLKGATFANVCNGATGEKWKFVPTTNTGYYQLRSELWDKDPLNCLEGNEIGGKELSGHSHMRPCAMNTGQLWRAIEGPGGTYILVTQFKENDGLCLTSYGLVANAPEGGAAFQATCENNAAQLFTITPW